MTDPHPARARLRTFPAPAGGHPPLISLAVPFSSGRLTLEYVPARLLLDRESFKDYLKVVPGAAVEQLVATIVEDLADAIVARSLSVTFVTEEHGATYTVTMEDHISHAGPLGRMIQRAIP